jgi:hypothetical protein
MIALIVKFLASTLGKYLLLGLGILAAWGFVKYKYESQGRAKERAEIIEAGKKNADKAKKARRRVDKIPDSRLRDRYYRD